MKTPTHHFFGYIHFDFNGIMISFLDFTNKDDCSPSADHHLFIIASFIFLHRSFGLCIS